MNEYEDERLSGRAVSNRLRITKSESDYFGKSENMRTIGRLGLDD